MSLNLSEFVFNAPRLFRSMPFFTSSFSLDFLTAESTPMENNVGQCQTAVKGATWPLMSGTFYFPSFHCCKFSFYVCHPTKTSSSRDNTKHRSSCYHFLSYITIVIICVETLLDFVLKLWKHCLFLISNSIGICSLNASLPLDQCQCFCLRDNKALHNNNNNNSLWLSHEKNIAVLTKLQHTSFLTAGH